MMNLQHEKNVLGSVLLHGEQKYTDALVEMVRKDHFTDPLHRAIFDHIEELLHGEKLPDATTVIQLLGNNHKAGNYVATLTREYKPFPVYKQALQHLRGGKMLRDMSALAEELAEQTSAVGADPTQVLDHAEAELLRIAKESAEIGSGEKVGRYVDEAMQAMMSAKKNAGKLLGISTGFNILDFDTQGFQPGHLVILAARPAVGKTTLGLQFAKRAALTGERVLFVSLEMSGAELSGKMIASEANMNHGDMKRGNVNDTELSRVSKAGVRLKRTDLVLLAGGIDSFIQMRGAIRRLHMDTPLDFIVIDYIGLLRSYDGKDGRNPRHQVVSDCSRGCKMLAGELGVPFLVLAQLNRQVEDRSGAVPRLSDLRESGSLEQDADMVMLLHRDKDKNGILKTETKLILAKNRHGKTGNCALDFKPELSTFIISNFQGEKHDA